MKILITGATGLVGQHLTKHIGQKYPLYQIGILTRDKSKARFKANIQIYEWDPYNHIIDEDALDDLDTVIHLAGESVAQLRWSDETKTKILDSRIIPTRFLKETIANKNLDVKFISASAIGIYGDRSDELLTTSSTLGDSFLANVCKKWEHEIFKFKNDRTKSYAIRIGIVLAKDGGALEKMITPFKLNLGSVIGDGKQYMSWIHIEDLVHIFDYLIHNDLDNKIINAVSPNPVTNKDFSEQLAKSLNKLLLLRAPAFIIKKALGEMAQIILTSQNVNPDNLLAQNFKFKFPYLKDALNNIVNNKDQK